MFEGRLLFFSVQVTSAVFRPSPKKERLPLLLLPYRSDARAIVGALIPRSRQTTVVENVPLCFLFIYLN